MDKNNCLIAVKDSLPLKIVLVYYYVLQNAEMGIYKLRIFVHTISIITGVNFVEWILQSQT